MMHTQDAQGLSVGQGSTKMPRFWGSGKELKEAKWPQFQIK
jgi:hypothetical protein